MFYVTYAKLQDDNNLFYCKLLIENGQSPIVWQSANRV